VEIVEKNEGPVGLTFDDKAPKGVMVKDVKPGTWAAEVGSKAGDEIVESML